MSEGKADRGLLYDYTTSTGQLKDIIPNITLNLMFIKGMPLKRATNRISNMFSSLVKRTSGANSEEIQQIIHLYMYMHNALVEAINADLVRDFRQLNASRRANKRVPDSSRYMLNDVLKMPDSIVSVIRSYLGRDGFTKDLENAIKMDVLILKATVHLIEAFMPRLGNAPQRYLTKYNNMLEVANSILSIYGGLGYDVKPLQDSQYSNVPLRF